MFFILSDSYVQNQCIAMKGPLYENDTFLYSPAPAILGYKLSRVALGKRMRTGVSLHFR